MTTAEFNQFTYDDSVDMMTVHTLFEPIDTDVLSYGHLVRLAAGTASVIIVRNFFTSAACAAIVQAAGAYQMGHYNFSPPMAKLGVAAYDFYKSGALSDVYFQQAAADTSRRATLLAGRDPLTEAREKLAAAWGGPVEPARSGGRQLFAGLIREINNGALLHFDEIARECPAVLDDPAISQLAFNCHLTAPATGGEVTIARRRWRPGDESHRDGYGYQSHLVDSEPAVTVVPRLGDAVLFDSRNFHRVAPCAGGRRVTLSFFIGISGHATLSVWS